MKRAHWNLLLVCLAAALLLVGAVIVYNEHIAAADHARTDANWSLIVPKLDSTDHIVGTLSAPIQVIVYADYQCAYCGRFFTSTIKGLQKQFGNDIVVAFRHLPIVAPDEAQVEAEAAECIAQIGGEKAFWNFTHAMYARAHVEDPIDLSTLPDLAVTAGVNRSSYLSCMDAQSGKATVEKEKVQGSIAGLDLTPGIVLKSEHRALVVKGDYPLQISTAIAYLLKAEKDIATQQQNK